jgi:hypothetical protein
MRKIFEQSERIQDAEIIHVYGNSFNEVFIGNVESECSPFFVFTPDEAIFFAREVIKVAKQIKVINNGGR